jgi:hypothetical protein
MAAGRINRREVVIGLPYSFCSLDVITVPPVDDKHLEAIVQRKMLKSSGSEGRDDAWSYEVIERPVGEERGMRVLLARIPHAVLHDLHEALRRHGIKPSMITVALTGVNNLVRRMSDEACRGSIMAVNAGDGGAMISIFVDKTLKQTRFLKERSAEGHEGFNSFLQTELRRSMSFHKEKYKGRGIDKILLLGTGMGRTELKTESFPIQLPAPENPPQSWIERAPESAQEDSGLLALLLGYLLAGSDRAGALFGRCRQVIDFALPRNRMGWLAAGACIATVAVVGAMATLTNDLDRANRDRALSVTRLEDEVLPFSRVEKRLEELLEMNRYYQGLNDELQSIRLARRNVAQAMLTVRECLPPWAELASITFSQGGEGTGRDRMLYQFKGDFTAGRSRALQAFIDQLRSTGLFSEVSFFTSGVQANPSGETGMMETIDLELGLK